MKLEDTKFISFGGGCFSNILLTRLDKLTGLNIRVAGPIDNLRSIHGISGSLKLFDGSLEEQIIGENAKYVVSIKKNGQQSFDECNKDFTFEDFVIVHNDYETDKCKKELKRRFDNFNNFLLESKSNPNYWFIYTLCEYDNKSVEELYAIKDTLKNIGILDRCIFIGDEIAKNPVGSYTKSNQVNWPEYNFQNWKTVFGNRYIVITDSDYYDYAAVKFYSALLNM